MKLFINARFLTQPISGVQRYGIECSRQIKALWPGCVFVTPYDILHHDIAAELGAVVVGKNKGHIWEQVDLVFYLCKYKDAALLNLANTGPLLFGSNYTVIHDLAFYHHPGWNSRAFSLWYNFMVPRLARRSRHIFTVSETVKKELCTCFRLPEGKVSVTYNGIGSKMLAAPHSGLGKEKMILSVGTFNIRKNQQTLVKAFLASDIKNEYVLVLAGDRNKVFRESGITGEMASDRIKIYDRLTDADLLDLYGRAEVVVSLSNYEGFGIPVIEGLYFGCKILCSDIPVYRELFSNFATFCEQNDVAAVASGLSRTVSAPPIAEESITLLLEKYNYRRAAETILAAVS